MGHLACQPFYNWIGSSSILLSNSKPKESTYRYMEWEEKWKNTSATNWEVTNYVHIFDFRPSFFFWQKIVLLFFVWILMFSNHFFLGYFITFQHAVHLFPIYFKWTKAPISNAFENEFSGKYFILKNKAYLPFWSIFQKQITKTEKHMKSFPFSVTGLAIMFILQSWKFIHPCQTS